MKPSDAQHRASLWCCYVVRQFAQGPSPKMTRNRTSYICLLTNSEVANSFCLRYWARSSNGKWSEPFQSLLSESGLRKGEMVEMLRAACRVHFPLIRCGSCGDQISVTTRSEYSSIIGTIQRSERGPLPPLCTSCSIAAPPPMRPTEIFTLSHRRDRVASELKRMHQKAKPIDYEKLSFFQSSLLYAALLAANIGPGESVVPPLMMQTEELAPTPELADEIYARLCTDGIFLPALSSDLNAFILDHDTHAVTLNLRAGAWTLAKDVSGRSMGEILTLLFRRLDQPEPNAVEALWYLVAEDECRRYFVSQWERYKFAYPGIYSAKVSATFQHYLSKCSIGQMWNVIYYAVKNLAALTQEGKHTPQHIYNMLPGGIRRSVDYRLANGQSIWPWNRPSPPAASWMTNILLDKILKAGDMCFKMLKGQDVAKYTEHLTTKPVDHPAATWFSVPPPGSAPSE